MKKKLKILYEDKYLLIVDKPYNLLCISTLKENKRTLFHYAYEYIKSKNKNNKIFIVHRLDRDTSGIVVFAKSMEVKNKLQNNWDMVKRGYVAVVNGKLKKDRGTLKNYLKDTKTLVTYTVKDKNGKLAILDYEKIMDNDLYSFVSINLKTGRKNQIRVQFSEIGNSIVGDKKYGIKKDPIKRMALHANYISFIHPITNQKIEIDIDIPNSFLTLFK